MLSETSLDWLRSQGILAEADDLDKTYTFEHPLNHRQELVRALPYPPNEPISFLWHAEFYTKGEEKVLEHPLARRTYPQGLPGRAVKIAFNANFYLLAKHQRQGFAKALYEAELSLYQRWGIKEIHIQAQRDGLHVWINHFGFLPIDPDLLLARYPSWARRKGLSEVPPDNLAELRKDFLMIFDQLDLVKVIA